MVAVVEIAGAEQLAELVRGSAQTGTPVGVRSSSGPAKLGRAQAPDGGVLADLSAMKRVIDISRRDRVALVEAGVTYSELTPLLAQEGLTLPHPLLPPPGKSVLASVTDREPTLIPRYHWDMTDPLLCAEVVFGTGATFRTGGAAGPGKTLEEQWAAGMHQKNPLGPAQSDLLKLVQGAQGTMGIATWVSLRCELLPRLARSFTVAADDLDPLARFAAKATKFRLGHETAIFDAAALSRLAPEVATGRAWTCVYTVGSLPYLAEESLLQQLVDIAGIAVEFGLTPRYADPDAVGALFGPVGPEPQSHTRRAHFLTTLAQAQGLVSVVASHWPETAVWVQPVNQGRAAHVEMWAPGAADEAADLALADDLTRHGAFLSRPHAAFALAAYRLCPDTVAALDKVKALLDPAGILNPGALWTHPGLDAAA